MPKKWHVGYAFDFNSKDHSHQLLCTGEIFSHSEDKSMVNIGEIENEKDANLVAFAPEMLEALLSVEETYALIETLDDECSLSTIDYIKSNDTSFQLVSTVLNKIRLMLLKDETSQIYEFQYDDDYDNPKLLG